MKIKMAVSDVATFMQQVNNLLIFLLNIDKLLCGCNISRYMGEEDEVEKLLTSYCMTVI